LSYAVPIGEHFKLKPRASIEYYRLKETATPKPAARRSR